MNLSYKMLLPFGQQSGELQANTARRARHGAVFFCATWRKICIELRTRLLRTKTRSVFYNVRCLGGTPDADLPIDIGKRGLLPGNQERGICRLLYPDQRVFRSSKKH